MSKWVILLLVVVEGGFMAFDGAHALVKGDYVTPSKGRFAGQLGPWRHPVRAVGIEPRSTLMKTTFLVYGSVWLVVTVCFVLGMGWTWWPMVLFAAGALWYLPFGTLCSVVQIVLLMLPSVRGA